MVRESSPVQWEFAQGGIWESLEGVRDRPTDGQTYKQPGMRIISMHVDCMSCCCCGFYDPNQFDWKCSSCNPCASAVRLSLSLWQTSLWPVQLSFFTSAGNELPPNFAVAINWFSNFNRKSIYFMVFSLESIWEQNRQQKYESTITRRVHWKV